MGVTGLLQTLKDIQKSRTLSDYRGKTLAVDTYGWLHRGLVSCAQELCQDVPTRKYINSVVKKIEMMRYFGVEPYLVFDGANLPTKAETAKERKIKREEARAKANEYSKKGNRQMAWKEYMKAAGVTPEMAKSIMVELDILEVKYVVAPYEADPQMVYLEHIGMVDGILSEDSDLLIFGCQKLITKLNDFGECIEINRLDFSKIKRNPDLSSYTPEQLRLVVMLSGCDYTKGVPGVGLKTAFSLVKKHSNVKKVLEALKLDGRMPPEDLEEEMYKANLAFQFQKVFNPRTQKMAALNSYPESLNVDIDTLELCCGKTVPDGVQSQISNGLLHPNTLDNLVSRESNLPSFRSKSFSSYLSTKPLAISETQSSIGTTTKQQSKIDSIFQTSKSFDMLSSTTKAKRSISERSFASKKIQKLSEKVNLSSNQSGGKVSKFFETPMAPKVDTAVDGKINDNTKGVTVVTEDEGSTMKSDHMATSSVPKAFDNSMDDLSDFSEHEDSRTEKADSKNLCHSGTFLSDCANYNSDIENNSENNSENLPGQTKESSKIHSLAKVLREKYLMNSDFSVTKTSPTKRDPLVTKDTNKIIKPMTTETFRRKELYSSDESEKESWTKAPMSAKVNNSELKPKNTRLQRFAFQA